MFIVTGCFDGLFLLVWMLVGEFACCGILLTVIGCLLICYKFIVYGCLVLGVCWC